MRRINSVDGLQKLYLGNCAWYMLNFEMSHERKKIYAALNLANWFIEWYNSWRELHAIFACGLQQCCNKKCCGII